MRDAPAPSSMTLARVAGYVVLVALGLAIGAVAGLVIGFSSGLIPFVC